MDKDLNELIEYLDSKFQKTATKKDLNELASKLVTLEEFDQFQAEVRQEFSTLRESIETLTTAIDNLAKAVSDLKTEYAVISHQLTRHEKWIQQIAGKVGIRLEY